MCHRPFEGNCRRLARVSHPLTHACQAVSARDLSGIGASGLGPVSRAVKQSIQKTRKLRIQGAEPKRGLGRDGVGWGAGGFKGMEVFRTN